MFLSTPQAAEQAVDPRCIYLAGFDVFRVDAVEHGERLKALCAQHGFASVFPLDHAPPPELSVEARAQWIYRANLDAIRDADIVMANLDDFRGPGEADSGTAFEIGFAVALGTPVWAYCNDDSSLLERARTRTGERGEPLCELGFVIEDFGLPKNLMLACATTIVFGGPNACIAAIAETYAQPESHAHARVATHTRRAVPVGGIQYSTWYAPERKKGA
jgi:nucleoside 2-deoxyribosyltransferase